MAAYKYWRLQVSATSDSYVQIAEVAFLSAAGVDLSVGGTAIASSEYGSGYMAPQAFDKNPSTSWCTLAGQFPGWIGYVHPNAVDVASVRVTWDSRASYLPTSISGISVFSSSDGVNWGVAQRVELVSGGLTASTTCQLFIAAAKPLISVDLPPPTHVPTLAYTGPYGHVVTTPVPLRTGDLSTPPLGKNTGMVYGVTEVKTDPLNQPVRARVLLLREKDGKVIRETYSNAATGAYSFDNVDTGEVYTTLTYYPTRDRRAVVADGLIPEEMP